VIVRASALGRERGDRGAVLAQALAIAGDVMRGAGWRAAADEHADLVAAGGEPSHDMGTDEAGASDDEHAHAQRLARRAEAEAC
jgi:hypothetical protein